METSEVNWQAYEEGHKAWDIYVQHQYSFPLPNPYQTGTEEWRSWQVGWNRNFNGI